MTQWLLEEALAIRLDSLQALAELERGRDRDMELAIDEARREAQAALQRG